MILFDALHDAEHVDEPCPEIVAHQCGRMETVDRGEPVRRRLVVMRIVAVIAVTDDRGAGVALVRDAVVYAGEHRRYSEAGTGVGTARTTISRQSEWSGKGVAVRGDVGGGGCTKK